MQNKQSQGQSSMSNENKTREESQMNETAVIEMAQTDNGTFEAAKKDILSKAGHLVGKIKDGFIKLYHFATDMKKKLDRFIDGTLTKIDNANLNKVQRVGVALVGGGSWVAFNALTLLIDALLMSVSGTLGWALLIGYAVINTYVVLRVVGYFVPFLKFAR
jgi:hypothetical protein